MAYSSSPLNRHRSYSVLTAVCLAGAMTVSFALPAQARTTPSPQGSALSALGVEVTPDGWITYQSAAKDSSAKLANATVTEVSGSPTADGRCTLTGTGDSVTPTLVEEVAFNPRTCRYRIRTSTIISGDPLSAISQGATPIGVGANLAATAVPQTTAVQGETSAAAVSYGSAHTKTLWIDPVNITITWNATNLRWPLNGAGGTLTSSSPYYMYPYDNWSVASLTNSGFVTLSDGWQDTANAHFVNTDFATLIYVLLGASGWLACGAHTTNRADFYHSDTVIGRKSGASQYSWSDSVSGACSNLVHHDTSNGTGWA